MASGWHYLVRLWLSAWQMPGVSQCGVSMTSENLAHKPLVEAILEVTWRLQKRQPAGLLCDPDFRLLPGRFFDRIQRRFPFHEPLPTANLPDEVVGRSVQHRFRRGKDEWPLVQIGPGILSVNETAEYTWDGFRENCMNAVDVLYDAHPSAETTQIEAVTLRYVDADEVDHSKDSALVFLKEKMGVTFDLPVELFEGGVESTPSSMDLRVGFRSENPSGRVSLRLAMGAKDGKKAIIWETTVQSLLNKPFAEVRSDLGPWLDGAHMISHRWFMALIDGELKRKYAGE